MPIYSVQGPDGNVYSIEGPEGATRDQVIAAIQARMRQQEQLKPAAPTQPVAPPQPESGALASGFKAYLPQLQETFGGLKTLLGVGAERVLGKGDVSQALIRSGAESMAEAEKRMAPIATPERTSFTSALDKGIGTVLTEWLPYQAGSGAANLLESLGLVAAGSAAGTAATPGLGTGAGAISGLVAKEMVKKGIKEATEAILKERGEDAAKVFFANEAKKATADVAKKVGATAALGTQAGFYGLGQTAQRAFEEAEKRGEQATDVELARVIPAGIVSSAAEFISDKIGLGAFRGLDKPTQNYVTNIARNIFVTGVKETPTEIVQSMAERFGAKLSLSDAQALKEYIDATAASFGMSTVPGTVGGVRGTREAREEAAAEAARREAAPPAPPPTAPEVVTAPPTAQQRIEEATGVSATPSGITPMTAEEAEAAGAAEQRAAADRARIARLQQMVEADMEAQAERARREGTQPRISTERPPERTRPSLAEREMPEATSREELLAKQAEVDQRRLAAGLPTGEASLTPGLQPTEPEVEVPSPVSGPLVDERPLTPGAARNRLLVLKNLYLNAGRDPDSLAIVPHPTVPERFAIQSLDRPVKLTAGLPGTAAEREPSPKIIDPVEAYVETRRRENTESARRFVQDWEAGRITREDVEQAIEQERKAQQPPALTYTETGERELESGAPYRTRPEVPAYLNFKEQLRDLLNRGEAFFVDAFTTNGQRTFYASPNATLNRAERIELVLSDKENEAANQAQDRLEAATTAEQRVAAENELRTILRPAAIRAVAEIEKFAPPAPSIKPAPPVEPPKGADEEPPPPPGTEPPVPTAEMPKTLAEFRKRMPVVSDSAKIRAANNNKSFEDLANALASSTNPVVARVGELAKRISTEVKLLPPKHLGARVGGVYNRRTDTVQIAPRYAGDEWVNAHEVTHALVARSQVNPTARQKPIVREIEELYAYVYKYVKQQGLKPNSIYGLTNPREFASEAMSNPEFQFMLMNIPYKGKRSAWTEFTRLVADLLGFKDPNALSEALNLIDRLAQTKRAPFSESMFGQLDYAVEPGATPMDVVGFMGMNQQKEQETATEKTKRLINEFKQDPAATVSSAREAFTQFKDRMENAVFSSDSAFNNKVRRELTKDLEDNKDIIGHLIEISQSQTVHSDAVAGVFLQMGGIKYDQETQKWIGFEEKNNFINLSRKIDEMGKKYNLGKEEAMRVAHANFVARRLRSLQQRNAEIEATISLLDPKKDANEIQRLKDSIVFIHLNDDQIDAGLRLAESMPELNQIADSWNGIRTNTVKVLVQSGMWTEEFANTMLDNIDYVPFYREDQLEAGAGPQEFVRGLQVKAREHKIKGSENAVNDVFDNMVRWTQYAINRAVRNHKELQLIDTALNIDVIDGKMAEQVPAKKPNQPIVSVFRDGKQEFYKFADPLFVDAFLPIQAVTSPSLQIMSWFANVLRQSVVLFPLFSVAQVPQDSFAAMFSSGLKTKYALRIPFLAVKEFVQTLTKTSAIHEQLKRYGAVGVRDFSSTVIRDDAEIVAGLKSQPSWVKNAVAKLQHISMSADNAVRQAVYAAAMQQGISKAEALEKAFEIINFRRRPRSALLNVAGQTIPFFYAYLAAQRVAYNTLTGVGISPQERKEGLKTLAYTSAAVMSLAMLYAMMNEGDEEYQKTPTAIKDRTITIPGTGGLRIPLRADFFLFPKIIAEHSYHLITENGFSDPAKLRLSMRDTLVNAIASPGPFPQIAKPVFEAAINYDFFQNKPLVGFFEQKKEAALQFRDSTSEFAKLMANVPLTYDFKGNKFEGISPIVMDHLIRGMFGSVGGLFLWGTNVMANTFSPDVERSNLDFRDALAALPSTGGLMSKPTESALKNDFYALRDEIEKANGSYRDYKKYSPEGLAEFLSNEKNIVKLGLADSVSKIDKQLSEIRKTITQVNRMPASIMSGEQKNEIIKELRKYENSFLKSAQIPTLRKIAQN